MTEFLQKYSNEWCFPDLLRPEHGRISPFFVNCGCGTEDNSNGPAEYDSYMHMIEDIGESEFDGYIRSLISGGAVCCYENRIDGNRFYSVKYENTPYWIYYRRNERKLRIIADRCKGVSVNEFSDNEYDAVNADTLFVQYSLHYSHMIKGTSCDCGMNYIFRLRDNSLIIIDGGEMEQATEAAVDDYMNLLYEITGTSGNEKIIISLWLCTHAHNDHADFFSKLLLRFSNILEVKRICFNFPNHINVKPSDSVAKLKKRISEYCSEAEYIKLHAGMRFKIANAQISILTSAEDVIECSDDPFGGMNASSSVFSVEADGVKILFLADIEHRNGKVLIDSYTDDTLECKFVQCAHHGINKIPEVYERIKAEKVLLPQCLMNMETRFMDVFDDLKIYYGSDNILFAYDTTKIFRLERGSYSMTEKPHTGTDYDGSEW